MVDCGAPEGNYRECGGYGRSGHATSGLNFSDQDLYKDYSGQEHTAEIMMEGIPSQRAQSKKS